MIKRSVTENGLVGDLFHNGLSQPQKAIIMLGGSEGGRVWSRVKRPVELLVKQGYSLFSLAYFKAQGLPDSLENIPIEYFEKAFAWLSAQPEIVSDEYAILGGSKGAEAALLLGSRYPQIKTVIAFSPSSVVWQGIPRNRFALGKTAKSSWSCEGKSLPFLPYTSSIKVIDLLTLQLLKAHKEALENTARVEETAIPVENTRGAIMLISGKRDRLWPSTKMSEQIMSRLTTRDFTHHYEHIAFDTGHNGLIMNKTGWRKIFDFLKQHFS